MSVVARAVPPLLWKGLSKDEEDGEAASLACVRVWAAAAALAASFVAGDGNGTRAVCLGCVGRVWRVQVRAAGARDLDSGGIVVAGLVCEVSEARGWLKLLWYWVWDFGCGELF